MLKITKTMISSFSDNILGHLTWVSSTQNIQRVQYRLGEKIVILKQLRTVSAIAEVCYQILYLLLSPRYFYKILKAYSTLY